MNEQERDELFRSLKEAAAACPQMRFGQLICNLTGLARGDQLEAVWEVEDSELIEAARKQAAWRRPTPAEAA